MNFRMGSLLFCVVSTKGSKGRELGTAWARLYWHFPHHDTTFVSWPMKGLREDFCLSVSRCMTDRLKGTVGHSELQYRRTLF